MPVDLTMSTGIFQYINELPPINSLTNASLGTESGGIASVSSRAETISLTSAYFSDKAHKSSNKKYLYKY